MFLTIALATAQTVDGNIPDANGQLFRPSIDSTHTLWTDDTSKAPDGYFLARGVVHYARDPVIYVPADPEGDVTRLVGDLVQLSVLGGFTKGPIRFGVDVPVYLRSIGTAGGETGLGDLAVDVKGTLLDRTEKAVGLALGGRVALPTATVEAPLGNRGLGWELQGILDKEVDKFLVTTNLGVKGVPLAELENFDLGTQLVARLGGGYAVSDNAGVSLDFGSHINLVDPVAPAIPVEGILGGWGRAQSLMVRGGLGTGLTGGFGAPSLRAILSLGYEPPRVKDTDADGIVDSKDDCRTVPEDKDGYLDTDGCPDPTRVLVRIVDQAGAPIDAGTFTVVEPASVGISGGSVELPGGDYQVDVAADGYVPLSAQVMRVPDAEAHEVTYVMQKEVVGGTVTVNIVDESGNPIPNATWSRRGDRTMSKAGGESVSLSAGSYTLRSEADGFRTQTQSLELAEGGNEVITFTMKAAKVELTGERIDIKDSVYFETAKAVIKPESYELLNEVAQIITDHPELTRIRIEGHTDSRGAASYNLDLSDRRAASVREYLIGKGVAADRLESQGFGESKPIAQGNNEAAWSKNRRVDFFVAARSD